MPVTPEELEKILFSNTLEKLPIELDEAISKHKRQTCVVGAISIEATKIIIEEYKKYKWHITHMHPDPYYNWFYIAPLKTTMKINKVPWWKFWQKSKVDVDSIIKDAERIAYS